MHDRRRGRRAHECQAFVWTCWFDVLVLSFRFHAMTTWEAGGGERSRSSAGVIRSSNCIGPSQMGHRQRPWYRMAGSHRASGRPFGGGSAAMSSRHSGNNTDRCRVLRMPKCRMRTKPLGSTCSKKRRRNSSTDRFIRRFLFLCAESHHRM